MLSVPFWFSGRPVHRPMKDRFAPLGLHCIAVPPWKDIGCGPPDIGANAPGQGILPGTL